MYYGNLRILQDSWPQNNVVGSLSKALGGGARQKLPFLVRFFSPAPKPPATPIYSPYISFVSTFGIGRSMLGPIRRAEEAYRLSQNSALYRAGAEA